jgi:hypothetical protein
MSLLSLSSFSRNQKRFLCYLKQYDNSITKYYNIDSPNLTINFETKDGYYEVNIVYDKKQDVFEFPLLPPEINKKINDYTKCHINITLNVNDAVNFPFTAPIWSIKELQYDFNFYTHMNIKEYYEYVVNLHNSNNKHWCCGMQHINTDLLNFIMIVNTFEYL